MSDARVRTAVDLNCDAGEGFGPWRMGDDGSLLEVVSSVNIACGFHAGDELIMRRTLSLAAARGVSVGAHPGPRDLWGFGRRGIAGEPAADLASAVLYQVGALQALAAAEGTRVTHLKLHGALSNRAAVDDELAAAVAGCVVSLDTELAWLVPSGSAMVGAGTRAGIRTVAEVFADRAYADDGTLLPRTTPGAVIEDPEAVAARALAMARHGAATAVSGRRLELAVDSICVHGDTPGAVACARAVRRELEAAGITVAPFARAAG